MLKQCDTITTTRNIDAIYDIKKRNLFAIYNEKDMIISLVKIKEG
jgi:hypothetical protein